MSTDVVEEKTKLVFNEDEQKIADAVKEMISIRRDTGEPVIGENLFDVARDVLGVSKKEVNKVDNLRSCFTSVVANIAGNESLNFMKENPHVTQVLIEDIDMGSGAKLNMVFDSTRKPKDFAEIGITVVAAQSKGSLGRVRKHLAAMAEEVFSQ